jgi:hypothetical protein
MRKSHNVSPFVRHLALLAALLGFVLAPQVVAARSDAPGSDGVQRYIVELKDPPLARYDGRTVAASIPLPPRHQRHGRRPDPRRGCDTG